MAHGDAHGEPSGAAGRMAGLLGRLRPAPGAVWPVRAVTACLWTAVAAGAVTGPAALTVAAGSPAQPPAPAASPTSSVAAEGFAELFVAAWLAAGEGQGQQLEPFLGRQVDLDGIRPARRWAARTITVGATRTGQGWTVTVAADVLIAADGQADGQPARGGWTPAGLAYYQVAVAEGDGHLVALDLPARVAAPPRPEAPRPDVSAGLWASTRAEEPIQKAVEGFIAGLLAGSEDLGRYLTAQAQIRPVTPAPFVEVEVVDVAATGTGPVRTVRAAVVATDTSGVARRLHYWLALSRRAGRWEVAKVLAGPPQQTTPQTPQRKGR